MRRCTILLCVIVALTGCDASDQEHAKNIAVGTGYTVAVVGVIAALPVILPIMALDKIGENARNGGNTAPPNAPVANDAPPIVNDGSVEGQHPQLSEQTIPAPQAAATSPPPPYPTPTPEPQALSTPTPEQQQEIINVLRSSLREQQEQTQLLQQQLWQSTFEMQKLRESLKKEK